MMIKLILGGAAIALPMVSAMAGDPVVVPVPTDTGDVFTGLSVSENSWYAYLGTNYALNGDIDSSGWLAQGIYGHGEYDYSNGSTIDGTVNQLDIAFGYQWVTEKSQISLLAGPNYIDQSLSPSDPSNVVQGDEYGAKFKATAARSFSYGLNGLVMGDYSTAFDSYWSRASLTKGILGLQVGPEFIAMGNEGWDEIRYGLTVGAIKLGPTTISLSTGYAQATNRGADQEGFYGAIHANYRF